MSEGEGEGRPRLRSEHSLHRHYWQILRGGIPQDEQRPHRRPVRRAGALQPVPTAPPLCRLLLAGSPARAGASRWTSARASRTCCTSSDPRSRAAGRGGRGRAARRRRQEQRQQQEDCASVGVAAAVVPRIARCQYTGLPRPPAPLHLSLPLLLSACLCPRAQAARGRAEGPRALRLAQESAVAATRTAPTATITAAGVVATATTRAPTATGAVGAARAAAAPSASLLTGGVGASQAVDAIRSTAADPAAALAAEVAVETRPHRRRGGKAAAGRKSAVTRLRRLAVSVTTTEGLIGRVGLAGMHTGAIRTTIGAEAAAGVPGGTTTTVGTGGATTLIDDGRAALHRKMWLAPL